MHYGAENTKQPSEDGTSASRTYATPALEKGLDILELLARQPYGLTKSEIARALNRSVSEIFRMLYCLESRKYVAQLEGDRYVLTLKLFQLMQDHPPTERLITEALPLMQEFARKSGQSCHLGVIEDGRVVALAQASPPLPVALYIKPGSSADIMESSTGYVILAHLEQEKRERTLADWRRVHPGRKITRDLEGHLQRIREKGYEQVESYQVRGIFNISFPILDARGMALAALTAPYMRRMRGSSARTETVELLRRCAQSVGARIGGKVHFGDTF